MGATQSIDWIHEENVVKAVKDLQQLGYKALAIEQTDDSTWLEEVQFEKNVKYCLVFGNEVFGVTDEVINICDERVEIPQFGTKHSFNISVSMGIVLWDYYLKTRN